MVTWGIVGGSHDASVAVFENDQLIDFVLMRDKHLKQDQINNLFAMYGKPLHVVWYEYPWLKSIRQLYAGQGFKCFDVNRYLKSYDIKATVTYTKHHLSHAAYAYYTQPHDRCAVIVIDSIGEFETTTVWRGKNNRLRKIYTRRYPDSLGLFYSAMTQRCGLVAQQDEGKMYDIKGDPDRYYNDIKQLRKLNLHRGCRYWNVDANSNDIAAATQKIFEEEINILVDIAKVDNLAFAGGCALNKYIQTLGYVPPNPGDAGSSIGAVLAKTQTRITL